MGQNDLGVSDLETQSIQELLAGDELTPVSIPAVLTTGTTYKRGEVLALNSSTNKYVKFDADGTNDTDKIAGILIEDVDASSGDVKSTIYIVGVFDKAALVTAESFDAGVHNSNGLLIIKELDD
jgi:hypothetical protein